VPSHRYDSGADCWQRAAAIVERKIGYEIGGKAFEGVLVYDDVITAMRPAVLMEPDWSGVSQHSVELARDIAGTDYVVFVADLFGVGYVQGLQIYRSTGEGGRRGYASRVRTHRTTQPDRLVDIPS
jgi:dienelactone hydrolase